MAQAETERPFHARLFVQGVANFVPHSDGNRLLALFPNQDRFHTHPFPRVPPAPDGTTEPPTDVCEHHAVVQMDLRHLMPFEEPIFEPPPWTTLHVEGSWVGFESEGGEETLSFPRKQDEDTAVTVPGVPHIESLLKRVDLEDLAAIDPSVLPTANEPDPPADLVTAGLYLDKGIVSSTSEFEGAFSFHEIGSIHTSLANLLEDEIFSGVVRVELGEVNKLTLLLRAFQSSEIVRIPVQPIGDTLDIWIRYFCDLHPPDPERNPEEGIRVDRDFRLNYLLRRDLPSLLVRAGNRLPIPRAAATWLRGGPIGGEPIKCMGGGSGGAGFVSPFLASPVPAQTQSRLLRIR